MGENWAWGPPTQEVKAELFTILPDHLRRMVPTDHGRNQKRGQVIDSFIEGPTVVDEKTLYLVDLPHGRIFAVDIATKEWTVVVDYDGEPNGLAWDAPNKRMLVADFKNGILALDLETKKMSVLIDRFNGERFKGPNDIIVARDGTFYFTDQGMTGLQDPSGRVYRVSPDGRVDVLLRNCPSPNGLVLDKEQRSLFVAMTRDNGVWYVPMHEDGSVQRTGRFSSYFGIGGPDGMMMDEEGNVFVAHSTLGTFFVHRKDGIPFMRISTRHQGINSTNLTWSGPKSKTLYMVESQTGAVMTLQWHCFGIL